MPRLLFVNPWIHDFAAYDLWYKPLGLLHLAEYLSHYGYEIEILDLLDRLNPQWHYSEKLKKQNRADGRGHFHKEALPKPEVLRPIPRKFSRYGAPFENVQAHLEKMTPPDAIILTSHMSYWYTGVLETAQLLRKQFPQVPLILGGIYASLMPQHALENIQPDLLISGAGELPLLQWLNQTFQRYDQPKPLSPHLRAVWNFYPELQFYPLLASRGCPFNCSFCATRILNPQFHRFSPKALLADLEFAILEKKLTHFVFFDDALFYKPQEFILPFLENAAARFGKVHFHTPNGLFAKEITTQLAEMMAAARFESPRLSLETINPARLNDISAKVTRKQYVSALKNLHQAGYQSEEIITYLLAGLPGQTEAEILEAIDFVYDTGAVVSLAAFSPIPGTREWTRCGLPHDTDPLLLNNTIYTEYIAKRLPLRNIRLKIKEGNEKRSSSRQSGEAGFS
jgi:radical SAM superfamily enzyme YgiQ (UPF0313 family)